MSESVGYIYGHSMPTCQHGQAGRAPTDGAKRHRSPNRVHDGVHDKVHNLAHNMSIKDVGHREERDQGEALNR